MHLFSINGANTQPHLLLITVTVLNLKVSMLWATFATLFCSKYFRELTISSLGHVKYAPKILAHLNKYPLIYQCLKGKSAPFPNRALFFRSASRNRNVFGRHAAGAGLLGSILFSSCSSRRENSKCVPKLFFGERSWLLGGEAGRQTQHFRIFCSPNALFF